MRPHSASLNALWSGGSGGTTRTGSSFCGRTARRAAMNGEMSDTEWEHVRPLMPPQKPATGRPRHDHRMILNGILSVTRTDASWREIPEECGKWETAYKRYCLWRDSRLWQRILTALTDETH